MQPHAHAVYLAIMVAAVGASLLLFFRQARGMGLSRRELLAVALGAFCGGMIGAKLPFVLGDWQGLLSGAAWFHDGKTIVSGLVGAYLGASIVEWALDIRLESCDAFAVPVAVGLAIGRLGCFYAGCCHGTLTSLAWGVDFGDGQLRHPTQLFEAAFHLTAATVLWCFQRRQLLRGRLVRLYFVSYFLFRFGTEFIRPEPRLWLGLTGYQWAALGLAPLFGLWCCSGPRPMAMFWRRRRRKIPNYDAAYLPLHDTTALCPTCLKPVPGRVVQRKGKVYLQRECRDHGPVEALISSDRRHYYLRHEVPHPPPNSQSGGSFPAPEGRCACAGPSHKTCIALLEITGQCNLHCPVCFAGSPGEGHRPLVDLCADVDGFLASRGPIEVLQISGGEPLLHPDLMALLDCCKQWPIGHVMINTNGLELLRRDVLAGELARRTPGLEVCLQFDGLDDRCHRALRGVDLSGRKRAVLERITAHGIPTTLVCTLVRGVNEDQVGGLLHLGLETPQVRGITFQPATWSGRFAQPADPQDRLTLADVLRLAARASDGLLEEDDFLPLPCANPNCCSIAFLVRRGARRPVPVTRLFDYRKYLDRLSDRIDFNLGDARQCCGPDWRREDFFRIVVKPFMDAYTYQGQRIDECCIHVIRPGGRAVSFCRFNVLERAAMRQEQNAVQEAPHVAGPA